jgi:pseudouridine synthase
MDLLQGVREYVYPVGRLDYDTEGLLLLTNDGDLAATLTHSAARSRRTYEARGRGVPEGGGARAAASRDSAGWPPDDASRCCAVEQTSD